MKKWGLGAFGLAAVAGVVALGASVLGGIAQAQEVPEEGTTLHELYQEKLAEELGVTVEELDAARESARNKMIDEALASGRITEEQAERLRNAEPGEFRGGAFKRAHRAIGHTIETVAEILGLTTEEIRAGLAEGNSLNDLAVAQGVADLESQLVAALTADIQAKVDDGSITQEQADQMIESLPERVSNLVEREGPFGRHGPRGGTEAAQDTQS
jgi:DNA-directed RNA polymerase specialized sigma subunit